MAGKAVDPPAWLARVLLRVVDIFEIRLGLIRQGTIAEIVQQITQSDTLRVALNEGWGIDRMVRAFEETIKMPYYRIERIARTEVIGASNWSTHAGAGESATEMGLDLVKEWIATRDERTRDMIDDEFDHRAMDGVLRRMDQPFMVPSTFGSEPLQFPGDPAGSAGNIINCRCTIAYVPADEVDAAELAGGGIGVTDDVLGSGTGAPAPERISVETVGSTDPRMRPQLDIIEAANGSVPGVEVNVIASRQVGTQTIAGSELGATYTPSTRTIALGEKWLDDSRYGSSYWHLPHEYGHAIDHQLAVRLGIHNPSAQTQFLSDRAMMSMDVIRESIKRVEQEILEQMQRPANQSAEAMRWREAGVESLKRQLKAYQDQLDMARGPLADWADAVRRSSAYGKLTSDWADDPRSREMKQYLTTPTEIFARSYEQFVFFETGTTGSWSGTSSGIGRYWDDDDFKPVAAALRAFFKQQRGGR
jgi:hypothetical protein